MEKVKEGKNVKKLGTEIDLDFKFKALDGTVDDKSDVTAGKLVSNMLSQATGKAVDPMKFWFWAQKLYNQEVLMLDDSDLKTFETFIKESESITVLGKAQILEAIKK